MRSIQRHLLLTGALASGALAASSRVVAQQAPPSAPPRRDTTVTPVQRAAGMQPSGAARAEMFERQALDKRLTDLMFFQQLGPEMIVRKITYAGEDQFLVPAYLFAPRDTLSRHPVLIMVHGGIHGDFETIYVPHVRSLVGQGYVVIAPEYRGSTGYGPDHYDAIDYGGKEVEDVLHARDYLKDLVPYADINRLGIIGWSHGGFITLHSIFRHPEYFKVAVANVPVADLPTRIKTHSPGYEQIFAAQKGFGATLQQNPTPYIDRSPIAHVRELKTPLLVHAASNDEDVFIVENHNLRDSMAVAGMDRKGLYTFREWQNPPGGHGFNSIQTPQAKESWDEILTFLAKHLKPKR